GAERHSERVVAGAQEWDTVDEADDRRADARHEAGGEPRHPEAEPEPEAARGDEARPAAAVEIRQREERDADREQRHDEPLAPAGERTEGDHADEYRVEEHGRSLGAVICV